MTFSLRPYQTTLVDRVRSAYAAGAGAPILQLPTGAGKTVIAAHIMGAAAARGKRTAFLVHRIELVRQTSNTLRAAGIPHGVIHPAWPTTTHRLQIASVQTLVRRMARFASFDFIVIDEAHHSVAGTWGKILEKYEDAHLLGLTATPSRLDGLGLGVDCGGCFDDLIVGPSMRELIEAGFLARPRVFASPRHINFDELRTRAGDFAAEDSARLMSRREIVGDAVEHYRRHLAGKRAIAFCVSVDHAEMVAHQFQSQGVAARRIDGSMGDVERAGLIAGFSDGRIKVITSCELISEGFDVPACDGALLLRPTQSETMYLQQVGRALRAAPGKTHAFILDHAGNVARHGLPDDDRVWTLDGRERRERGPQTKQCPQCFAVLPLHLMECPECEFSFADMNETGVGGGAREVEQRDGELIELTAEMIAERRRQQSLEVRVARTREELLRIAQQRGYNPRWVDHVLSARARGTARAA